LPRETPEFDPFENVLLKLCTVHNLLSTRLWKKSMDSEPFHASRDFNSLKTFLRMEETLIGFAFVLWTFPMRTITFLILPKIVSPRKFPRYNHGKLLTKRGDSQGGIRVFGMGSGIGGGPSSGHRVRRIKL
jgi:hypothetical protein